MSIVTTKDLRCDDCGDWAHGGGKINHTDVRMFAKRTHGWTTFREGRHLKDICPTCIQKRRDADLPAARARGDE